MRNISRELTAFCHYFGFSKRRFMPAFFIGFKKGKMIGKRYGKLIVLEDSKKRQFSNVVWKCICDCGNITHTTTNSLNMGKTKSCGCTKYEPRLPSGQAGFNELYLSYKRDAKKRSSKKVFNLSPDEFKFIITQPCVYCGSCCEQSKFGRCKVMGGKAYNLSEFKYTGIDRQNNLDGYTIENAVPCCRICNIAKASLTLNEFKNWIIKVYKHLNSGRKNEYKTSDSGQKRFEHEAW